MKTESEKVVKKKSTPKKNPGGERTKKSADPGGELKKTAEAPKPKKDPIKILFAVSEATPFIMTGGMGEVAGSLPHALQSLGEEFDARIIVPLYGEIRRAFGEKLTFLCSFELPLAWRSQYCGLFTATHQGVTYYFVDNEYYFDRSSLYGSFDDGERFAFFSKAVLAALPAIEFFPDVLHAHDWQTALVPIYLRTAFAGDSRYRAVKSVFTIHNIEYQGKFSPEILVDVFDLSWNDFSKVEYNGGINLMKGAIECADWVTTVSRSYVEEIKDEGVSHGLSHIVRRYEEKFSGILNGIDTESYNPETDPALFQNYSAETIEDKAKNKYELRKMLSLPEEDASAPLIAVVSRLVAHKGMDLISEIADDLLYGNLQFVILGKGDRHYEDYFEFLQRFAPARVRTIINFSSDLARKIYAAADLYLMPSKSEPCGLAQMIAARYGTIPIVRETGGLKDSIKDCSLGDGNGFSFKGYNGWELKDAVSRALSLYHGNKEDWVKLQKAAMSTDFSWGRSAVEYARLYENLTGKTKSSLGE